MSVPHGSIRIRFVPAWAPAAVLGQLETRPLAPSLRVRRYTSLVLCSSRTQPDSDAAASAASARKVGRKQSSPTHAAPGTASPCARRAASYTQPARRVARK